VITRTGSDPFGAFLHDALRGYGVDDRYVSAVPDLPTPMTFCEIFPPRRFSTVFLPFPQGAGPGNPFERA
jgi:5-dehydro-2-deoxygluconokinase